MALIITGHFRSGTTILKNLCQAHPQIDLTNEAGFFYFEGKKYWQYCKHLFHRWRITQNYSIENYPAHFTRKRIKVHNLLFLIRFIFWVNKYRHDSVQVGAIEAALKRMYPQAEIVGDKYPAYSRQLDKLSGMESLKIAVIFRDCRDVTSSALQMMRTHWQDRWWIGNYDSAEKIAANWVHFIDIMESCPGPIYKIRYEDFVTNPEKTMKELGRWLAVDPQFFPTKWVKSNSVGKYRAGLTGGELDDVMRVAGPAMAKLGYG